MNEQQARELRDDLARYGDDATYLIRDNGEVLLFTAVDDHTIRAKIVSPGGQERDEPAPAAMRELRAWIEQHRKR